MSMLELRRVSKVYRQGTAGVHALADVSLPVDEGSMVAEHLGKRFGDRVAFDDVSFEAAGQSQG